MVRICLAIILISVLTAWAAAQDISTDTATTQIDRSATGGATTLEDILRRQRGEHLDNSHRQENTGSDNAAAISAQLGVHGGASDSEVFRALRFGSADVTVSSRGPAAEVIIQDGGMWWLRLREGPLAVYGAWLLGAVLAVIAVFYALRGRIRIDGAKVGKTVLRFNTFERFGHWLFAGSFLILALTGLALLFGRSVLIPVFGKEAFSTFAVASKWIHNNVAWAFMIGLIIITVNWITQNVPNRHDLIWLAKAGGLFSKGVHPPARKFNAGQKIIFWGCVVLGVSISASGLSLLFPFELPMYAKTFAALNATGLPELSGFGALPETLTPHQEMQFSQLWHTIIAFVFIAMIIGHIYLGSIGMEGAFDAMGTGEVDLQWAREHHGLWVREEEAKAAAAVQAEHTSA